MRIELQEKPGYLLVILGGRFDGEAAMMLGNKIELAFRSRPGGGEPDVNLILDLSELAGQEVFTVELAGEEKTLLRMSTPRPPNLRAVR